MTAVPHFWQSCPSSVAEHESLRAITEHVAQPSVRAVLRDGQQRGEYPQRVLGRLEELGLSQLFGPEATAWHLGALQAELAAADGTLAITVGVSGLALLPVHLDGSPELRRRVFERVAMGERGAMLLTEWAHGSDLLANETRARACAGGFRLEGRKSLINGGSRHALLTVLARTRDRSMDTAQDRRAALGDHTLFWAPRDTSVVAIARHQTLPTRGADIAQVELRGTEVGADAIIGAQGDGFSVVRRTLSISRGGIAALAAGAVAATAAQARTYAQTREVYGAPILELDAIADHVAELAELNAECSAIALRATAFANAFGVDAAPQTAAAKLVTPRLAERATDLARRVLGSRALLEDHDLARFIRDVPLYGIFDGTQHVMLEELGFGLDRLARGRRLDDADSVARARAAWTTAPRRLSELGRPPARLRPIDPRRHAAALASGAHWSWAATLPALLETLFELRQRLLDSGAWAKQSIRFLAAEALAWTEGCFACLELADPGIAPLVRDKAARDAELFEAAGCRRALAIAARLQTLAAAVAWRPSALGEHRATLAERSFLLRRAAIEGGTEPPPLPPYPCGLAR